MKAIHDLTREERVFLAGCMKSIIMSDGEIDDQELADLDSINENLKFTDFEECLDDFEKQVTSTEDFWEMARQIGKDSVKDLILDALSEIAYQDGFPAEGEVHLLQQLTEIWDLKKNDE